MATKFFKVDEFRCKCPCNDVEINLDFLHKLNFARSMAGIPFIVNSGYRCKAHNEAVGSLPTSSHRFGLAADLRCRTSRERYIILKALMAAGFNRIGIGKTFIHVDADEKKDQEVIWLY